jgi:hypothetical protein
VKQRWYEQLIEEAEKGLDDMQAGRLKSVAELRARYRSRGIESPNTLPLSAGREGPSTPDDDPPQRRSGTVPGPDVLGFPKAQSTKH